MTEGYEVAVTRLPDRTRVGRRVTKQELEEEPLHVMSLIWRDFEELDSLRKESVKRNGPQHLS